MSECGVNDGAGTRAGHHALPGTGGSGDVSTLLTSIWQKAGCWGRAMCEMFSFGMTTDVMDQDGPTEPATLKVVILYDEAGSGRRAKRLFDRVAQGFSGQLQFTFDLCRFAWLEIAGEAESFRGRALDTELLVVALREGESVPQIVTDWLDGWAQSRITREPALVLLPSPPPEHPESPGAGFQALRSLAERHRLDCLEPWSPQTGRVVTGFAAELREREHAITPTLAGITAPARHQRVGTRSRQPREWPTALP